MPIIIVLNRYVQLSASKVMKGYVFLHWATAWRTLTSYALKEAIEQDLAQLENLGIIEKVNLSEWASPIVPVPKPNGAVRICRDYKITVNWAPSYYTEVK